VQPLPLRPALVDQVHQRLADAIAAGELAPGTPLKQEELAERLGVSRQPVSHALALLKQEGLLVEYGRRGLQVVPLEPGRLKAIYQVRAALDRLAAGLAADRAPFAANHLADAGRALEAGRRAVAAVDATALVAADVAFHQAVIALAGNPVLEETAARQWPHVRRAMAAVLSDAGSRSRVWDEHAAILDAIAAGRADDARERAEAHALRAAAETVDRLEQDTQVA